MVPGRMDPCPAPSSFGGCGSRLDHEARARSVADPSALSLALAARLLAARLSSGGRPPLPRTSRRNVPLRIREPRPASTAAAPFFPWLHRIVVNGRRLARARKRRGRGRSRRRLPAPPAPDYDAPPSRGLGGAAPRSTGRIVLRYGARLHPFDIAQLLDLSTCRRGTSRRACGRASTHLNELHDPPIIIEPGIVRLAYDERTPLPPRRLADQLNSAHPPAP